MSYNFTLAVLPDRTLESVGAEGPAATFDEATSMMAEGLTAAQIGPHVVLADPMFGEQAKAIAAGAQLYLVMFGGTVDQYVVQAVGPVERLRVQLAGELVEDEGEPLEVETVIASEEWPEDGHVRVIEQLTGVPFAELMDAEFRSIPV